MRVFVEVDHLVEHSCLEVAIALRVAFKHCCVIQICAFAQDPIFSGQFHDQNFKLFQAACQRPEVDVIGTTPYVEDSEHDATRNYKYAIDTAEQLHKPCDLHIDYNLDPATSAVTMSVLDYLKNRQSRTETPAKNTCLGHCTRLTLLGQQDWKHIASTIKDNDLSVSLLGKHLPYLKVLQYQHHQVFQHLISIFKAGPQKLLEVAKGREAPYRYRR